MCCCVIGKLVWRRLDGFGDLSSLGSLGSFVNVTIMMLVWCGSYAVFKNFCQNRFLTFQLVTKTNNPRFNAFTFSCYEVVYNKITIFIFKFENNKNS